MTDISKCTGAKCPLKETCYRYTSEANPLFQGYCNFSYDGGKCDDYLAANKEVNDKNYKPLLKTTYGGKK